jgi:hypothetical protein
MATNRKLELSGKVLRWVLCIALREARRPLSIAELVASVEDRYVIVGRAGKTVSDALRWEVRRGRVLQKGRGRYSTGRIQRSTEWSMRRRIKAWELSLVAQSAAPFESGLAPALSEVPPRGMSEDEARWLVETGGFEERVEQTFAAINIDDYVTAADDRDD